jgi:hypothetical protein
MSTWLLDTSLFKMLVAPKSKPLLDWCEANDASLYISAASLTQVALAVEPQEVVLGLRESGDWRF